MKRKTLWSIVALVAAVLVGGGIFFASRKSNSTNDNSASYQTYMQAGKDAAQAKKYAKAADQFGQAYNVKATKTAKHYQDQAQNLADSVNLAKTTTKYQSAVNLAQKAQKQTGGYSVMTTQAKKLVKTLKAVLDNYQHEIKPLLKSAASDMTDGNYSDAASTYSKILDLPYINGAYYAKVRSEVKSLLKEAKSKSDDSDSSSSSSSKDSSSSSKSSSKDKASSSADSSSSSSNQAEGQSQSSNDKVNGSTVTSRDTQQIRNQLDNLGVGSSGWSPQDLINLFRYASSQGHTTIDSITKSDVEGYLNSSK
ncbi:Putative uncharacterized protein [Lactobacillus equicursoris DSM 19284 = JCM 14600 = CIP 110162]|uniref:hypothetical protein n=1 Tax=Lactobacillus equicursoris TaxID=420645 RepID=UPI000283F2D0|nr:hypothetical protein [Lactobacillus equicursoris]CCK86511.1 Putative uncharacterized protein [Lactobacillus equicursoris DSM 19284 = JCM 14600 = CIP 110162]